MKIILISIMTFIFTSNLFAQDKITAKYFYLFADSIANSKYNDPHLYDIMSTDVDTSGKALSWKYSFMCPTNYYSVFISSDSTVKDSSFESFTGVSAFVYEWIDSDSALKISESNGGREFRDNYNDYQIIANLWKSSGDVYNGYWSIKYYSKSNPEKNLTIEINSVLGTIVSFIEGNARNPVSFKLSQNFPNPFRESTKVTYSIEKSNLVNIKLYDVRGREIKLYSEGFQNTGEHIFDLNLQDKPTGLYFLRFQAGDYCKIIKITHQK